MRKMKHKRTSPPIVSKSGTIVAGVALVAVVAVLGVPLDIAAAVMIGALIGLAK